MSFRLTKIYHNKTQPKLIQSGIQLFPELSDGCFQKCFQKPNKIQLFSNLSDLFKMIFNDKATLSQTFRKFCSLRKPN